MCAEHGQCIHPWYRIGIPCIECEMAECSRERGTWNWPFYLPHLDSTFRPPMLMLEFVGDSPFSVYSPALQPFDTRKHLRQQSTARQKADVSTNFQRARKDRQLPAGASARDGLFCTIADGLTIRSSEHPSSVPPVLFIQLYSKTDSLLRCQLLLDPAG